MGRFPRPCELARVSRGLHGSRRIATRVEKMSQILSQVPRHLLQQQQRLTPQLIQAMDILQLNAMALESRLAQELDANPALDLLPTPEETPQEPAPMDEVETDRPEGEQALIVEGDGDGADDFNRLDNLVREYDWIDDESGYRGTRSAARLAEEGEQKIDAMANTAARPAGLQEHLLAQWGFMEVDDETHRIGEAIIESLDDTGRVAVSLEAIAEALDHAPSVAQIKDALARVQQLEPPGVAARDLKECLLLQVEALPLEVPIAAAIVEEHLEDLQKNRLPLIARRLGVELDAVKDAVRVIGRLSLHPGLEVVERSTPIVIPDVIVEYNEETDRYDVRLARVNQRELRISPEFRAALEQSRDDKLAREFLKQKLDAAAAIIDAIRYRRERLLEVAKSVVEAQRDFLDLGEQHMKVLRMSDLAAQFGCDPSTISRTVDEKWIETPRGVYPLRRFFTGGTSDNNGDSLGWDSIKAKVSEIVAAEDKTSPLNDDEIVERLRQDGIDIKRRTVAKYRAQLGIPKAQQRRQY